MPKSAGGTFARCHGADGDTRNSFSIGFPRRRSSNSSLTKIVANEPLACRIADDGYVVSYHHRSGPIGCNAQEDRTFDASRALVDRHTERTPAVRPWWREPYKMPLSRHSRRRPGPAKFGGK